MKGNPDKCHLLLSAREKVTINAQDLNTINCTSENLLGITIGSNLNFQSNVNNLSKKASSNIHGLGRVAPYINIRQRRLIMSAFFNSQFG